MGADKDMGQDQDVPSEDEEGDERGAGLLVKEREDGVDAKAGMWFSQDEFDQMDEEEEDDEAEIMRMMQNLKRKQEKAAKRNEKKSGQQREGETKEENGEGAAVDEVGAENNDGEGEGDDDDQNDPDPDFMGLEDEEVFNSTLREESSGDEDDEHVDRSKRAMKIQDQAETLALAKMLRSGKTTEHELIDNSYNRYAFDDPELPKWFTSEERDHARPNLPCRKEDVARFKEELKAVNARSIKKVAEAKARKKKRLVRKMERVKAQAEGILENGEIAQKDKMREIERLYARRGSTKTKISKNYVVSKQGGRSQTSTGHAKGTEKRTRFVDKRLKKDKRQKAARERQKKKKAKLR